MSGARLELENLGKSFRGLRAVHDVSFTVPAGAIHALIGPNGAGKTTIFNMIAGVYTPTAGTVSLDGRRISGLRPDRVCDAGVGRTFQIVKPFAAQTVRENIAVGVHLHVRNRREALDRAQQVAAQVGLAPQLDKPASDLTVAGRKRLELARALATKPRLLLLDEVLACLNPHEIAEMMPVVRGIADSGVTVFMIEHVMQAVMHLAEHVWVLAQGQLIAEGSPAQVTSDDKVVEAYLGHGTAARLRKAASGVEA